MSLSGTQPSGTLADEGYAVIRATEAQIVELVTEVCTTPERALDTLRRMGSIPTHGTLYLARLERLGPPDIDSNLLVQAKDARRVLFDGRSWSVATPTEQLPPGDHLTVYSGYWPN